MTKRSQKSIEKKLQCGQSFLHHEHAINPLSDL